MRLTQWFRTWRRRRQFEEDLAEEIRIHREMSGAPAFGSEALALEQSREVWGFAWLDGWKQDVRYALRGLRRSPAFLIGVLGALGLGIGLNTAGFTIFNAYALRPYAVHGPYSLYEARWLTHEGLGEQPSLEAFESLRERRDVFTDAVGTHDLVAELSGRGMFGQLVTENYFHVLGVGMEMGRPLLPGDESALVLSYDAWRNKFAEDPAILGSKLYVRGHPFEVVGVTRRGFSGIQGVAMGYWIPYSAKAAVVEGPGSLDIVGRLRPDVRPAAARTALLGWAQNFEPKASAVRLESRASSVVVDGDAIFVFLPLIVAFGLVLLTACANVSNMMLARALARQREIAIRVSLGAGRGRLIRQLLTESAILALPAAAVGILISQAMLAAAVRVMFATLPAAFGRMIAIEDLSPDWRVLAYVVAAALGSAMVFGLAPAIQSTRPKLRTERPSRLRNALVITQAAVCSLLLICTLVVLRVQRNTVSRDIGLDTHGVWEIKLLQRYQDAAGARMKNSPGVTASAMVCQTPVYGGIPSTTVVPSGAKDGVQASYNFVGAGYFDVFRVPVIRGRTFSESESGAAVAVVSESTARRFWPGHDALGESITIPQADPAARTELRPAFTTARVIGVVRDAVNGNPQDRPDVSFVYFPDGTAQRTNQALVVRLAPGTGDPRRLIEAALEGIAPQAADYLTPMDDVVGIQLYPFRVALWVTGALGSMALLLTISGIYGVMSYLVTQRTKEIGIRVALGAERRNVIWLVARQATLLAGIGALVGGGLALGAAPVLSRSSDVTEVNPYYWPAYAGTAVLVLLAALGAAVAPSRRAVRIDPAATLRAE